MISSISQSESVSIATSKIKLNVSDELIDIDYYSHIDGVKINIPIKSKYSMVNSIYKASIIWIKLIIY